MPEIGTSGPMSGEGKRGDAQLAQATAPLLDSTLPERGMPAFASYISLRHYDAVKTALEVVQRRGRLPILILKKFLKLDLAGITRRAGSGGGGQQKRTRG